MRANINFEVSLDKVEDTMRALVSQEANTLNIAANILDTIGSQTLLEEVTETLDLLQETSVQLQQYRDMLVSFEQAKFETILPRPAADPIQSVKRFDNFLDKINSQEVSDDPEPQEG